MMYSIMDLSMLGKLGIWETLTHPGIVLKYKIKNRILQNFSFRIYCEDCNKWLQPKGFYDPYNMKCIFLRTYY